MAERKPAEPAPRRLLLVRCDSARSGSPHARSAREAGVKTSGGHLRRRGPSDLRDTPRVMSEESTTPDLVELTRQPIDAMNRR